MSTETQPMDERPENTERLAYYLGFLMGKQIERGQWTRQVAGHALLDGPLSDLSVLVQIPKVREVVEAFVGDVSQVFMDGRFPKVGDANWSELYYLLADALEATDV